MDLLKGHRFSRLLKKLTVPQKEKTIPKSTKYIKYIFRMFWLPKLKKEMINDPLRSFVKFVVTQK